MKDKVFQNISKTGKVVAVLAARMNSSRMYGKSMASLSGIPSLEHIINRLQHCRFIDDIVVATTETEHDDPIRECTNRLGVLCFSGSENDILDRTVKAANLVDTKHVVIVNGDSPIIDPQIVDIIVQTYLDEEPDYASNTWIESWPIGTEAEVCSLQILEKINNDSDDPAHHEHVTLYIHENRDKYKVIDITAPEDERWPELRLTLDTKEDYKLISLIYESLFPNNPLFGIKEIIDYVKKNPHLLEINLSIKQKEVR